jgi:tetratricopeptide (TPR) repeat protein
MALKFSSDPEISKTARRNIAITYIQLGKAAEGGGNPFQAIAYYRQAVSSDAMFPDAYFYLGSALDQIHHEDEALGEYDKAIQYGGGGEFGMAARQNAAVIFHRRGDQALQQGQTDVAIQWWRKALEIAPGTQAGSMAQDKLSRYGG